jgi:hypothetical protein
MIDPGASLPPKEQAPSVLDLAATPVAVLSVYTYLVCTLS